MMDPTLASEQIFLITQNDLRALDLIGYEINAIPEGAGWLFGALATSLGGLAYLWQRKRAG
jgi:hypothetical protein